jgi:adenylate kinase family enzyme
MHSLALSGDMASGKSSVASLLSARYGYAIGSFGQLIRREAKRRHLGQDRRTLQALGQELLADLGAVGLVDELLATVQEPVVIDGVRHIEVLAALRERLPELLACYLSASAGTLDERWSDRGDDCDRVEASRHATEQELDALRAGADIVLATDGVAPAVVARLLIAAAADYGK